MKNILKENPINQKKLFSINKLFMSRLELRSYNLEVDSGMTLIFSTVIISNILLIAFAIGLFGMSQFRIAISIKDSSYAIFGATTGIERALDQTRNEINTTSLTVCDTGTVVSPVNLFSDVLGNSSQYSASCYIKTVDVTDCDSSKRLMIVSNGTYKQTTRKIEANFCR